MTHAAGYALGDLITRAREGYPLELAARGDVVRSYVGVEEILLVALGELLDGRSGLFETAGAAEVEVEELARTSCRPRCARTCRSCASATPGPPPTATSAIPRACGSSPPATACRCAASRRGGRERGRARPSCA